MLNKLLKIIVITSSLLLLALAGFSQANTITAKLVNASSQIQLRAIKIDSITSDPNFTNNRNSVLPTQGAVKGYVSPIKARADSLAAGLFKDSLPIAHVIGKVWNIYPSSDQLSIIDKGWDNTPTGDAYVRTKSDSSTFIVLKKVVNPSSCSYCTVVYDSAGRILSTSSGTPGSGVIKKTLNAVSSNYNIVAADTNKYITVNAATPDTVFIPDDATAVINAPANIAVYQTGGAKIFFKGLNGLVAVNSRAGRVRSAGQYAKVELNKISSNNWILSGDLDSTTVGFLTVSTSSLSGYATTQGTPSFSQNFTTSGFNLTAGATVTAPTNFEVSADNITFVPNFNITLSGTSLTGQPVPVYARIKAASASGFVSGNVTITSTGVNTQTVGLSGNVSATVPDSARFQFDTTSANDVAGWIIVRGDPSVHVISGNLGSITYSTVSTNPANWGTFFGACIGLNNGVTNSNVPYSGSTGVNKEAMNTSNNYQTTNAQFVTGGWKTDGTTYDIIIGAAINPSFGVAANGGYSVRGSALQTELGLQASGNVSNVVSWTSIAPDGSGNFTFYVGKNTPGEQVGAISWIIIRKH